MLIYFCFGTLLYDVKCGHYTHIFIFFFQYDSDKNYLTLEARNLKFCMMLDHKHSCKLGIKYCL
jgi:hypothetical protein